MKLIGLIDDARFVLLEGTADTLTEDEKNVINLVVNTFGMYSGKVPERITHNEDPWKEASKGCGKAKNSSETTKNDKNGTTFPLSTGALPLLLGVELYLIFIFCCF